MKKLVIVAGALASTALANGQARAADCATASFSPATVDFAETWDPMISPASQTLTFQANFSNFASGAMKVKLIFLDNESGVPLRLGSAGPRYTVTSGSQTYAFPSGTSVTSQPEISLTGPNPTVSRTFSVTIPANTSPIEDFVGGQTPSEPLKFTLQCLRNNNSEAGLNNLQTGPTIRLTVPRLVSLTVASPQTINFGNFSSPTQTLQVGVKSTSSVNVAVSTTNGALMVRSGASFPYPDNSKIPYSMTFNGDAIVSGSSLSNRTRAGVAGTNWPLVLALTGGIPSGKVAGSYSDTITLTLSPGT